MNKEQQIVEFQNDIIDNLFDGGTYKLAEALYNAGYRKTFTSDFASDTQKAYKEGYEKGIEETVEKPVDTSKKEYPDIDGIVSGFVVKDGNIIYGTNILDGYRHEFKDIHEICDELNNNMKKIDRLMEVNNHLCFQLKECKKSIVKEFAEKLKKKVHNYYPSIDSYCTSKHVILVKDIDELLKEFLK